MSNPDRAGQAVKDSQWGNPGITASGVDSHGYIDVMFLGDVSVSPMQVARLELINLEEV